MGVQEDCVFWQQDKSMYTVETKNVFKETFTNRKKTWWKCFQVHKNIIILSLFHCHHYSFSPNCFSCPASSGCLNPDHPQLSHLCLIGSRCIWSLSSCLLVLDCQLPEGLAYILCVVCHFALVLFGVLTWFLVYWREGNMVSIWVWVQKSPGIKTVALMLWKSHLIDALASHLTAFQHLEIRSSEHTCPPPFHFYQRPWWVKQLSPVRPEEMVKYWSCSQRFVDSEVINKSELLSRAGLWRGICAAQTDDFQKFSPTSSLYLPKEAAHQSKESPWMPLFFFSFPDIWKSTVINGGVHFLSARRHNHLKSQEKKNNTGEFHCRAANESKAPSLK